MNRAMRMLTLVGLGLMTGATIGAAPAMAADGAGKAAAKPAHVTVKKHFGHDEIVGYYRTRRACELAGRIGERRDRWEDYDCERVRWGFRRGKWALEVERNHRWFRPGHVIRPIGGQWNHHRPFGGQRPWGGQWNHNRPFGGQRPVIGAPRPVIGAPVGAPIVSVPIVGAIGNGPAVGQAS